MGEKQGDLFEVKRGDDNKVSVVVPEEGVPKNPEPAQTTDPSGVIKRPEPRRVETDFRKRQAGDTDDKE